MKQHNIQIDENGGLRHLLTTEGLKRQLLVDILDHAENFTTVSNRSIKKIPLLRGSTIANLFFEPSTRTRTTFELAAKRLSADVLNININTSATTKGESLLDMLHNLEAMHCDMFVVRHAQSGAAHFIARHVAPHIRVINAGDGTHEHPSQGLLDMLTVREHKGRLDGLKVAIIGDILHSRVAHSDILGFTRMGSQVFVYGPSTLIPPDLDKLGATVCTSLKEAVQDADVVMTLRIQKERQNDPLLPSFREYAMYYGVTAEVASWAKPDGLIMHPGPINRGVEIDSNVADGKHSVILQQVSHGIAVRMAVMAMVMSLTNDDKN